MAAAAVSPSSSPRLPSPPPIAEDQLGPKSPVAATEEQQKLFSSLDHGASRRIRPGTKAEDMAEGPPLVDLSEIDSAFQLTEHLKALHNSLTHPADMNMTMAVDKEIALKIAQPPDNVDKTLWLYELCRFLTQKANSIIIALFDDKPPCSAITCPEMRASEWQYLCAVHDPPKSCCAIDYCCHTLDWAANTLTSPKNFPSRLAMGTDQSTQHQQIRNLTNIFRRVYRIFAHAWFQHRDMFWKVEGRTGLYILFKTVCDVYGLIPEDNYTIPSEAEGLEPSTETATIPPPLLLKRPDTRGAGENSSVIEGDNTLSTAGTTKRHRHSPSVGAMSVSTVVEENEEEEESEEPAKDEPGTSAPHEESTAEAAESSTEDKAEADEPKIGEEAEAEASEEPPLAPADGSHVASEIEEQASGEENPDPEPHKDGTEPEAAIEAESASAETPVPEQESEEEPKQEAEEPSQEAPEKAEKDEATADPDKSTQSE